MQWKPLSQNDLPGGHSSAKQDSGGGDLETVEVHLSKPAVMLLMNYS